MEPSILSPTPSTGAPWPGQHLGLQGCSHIHPEGLLGVPRPCPRGHGQAQLAFPGPHGLLWLRDVRDPWESTKALTWGQDRGLGDGSDWKGVEAVLEGNRLSWAAGLKGGSLWSSPGVRFYLLRLHQVVAPQARGQVG